MGKMREEMRVQTGRTPILSARYSLLAGDSCSRSVRTSGFRHNVTVSDVTVKCVGFDYNWPHK